MKPLGEVLRAAGWWLDAAERSDHGRDLLHNRMADIVACVVHREDVTPDEALDLLRNGYLWAAMDAAVNDEQVPTRRPAAAPEAK